MEVMRPAMLFRKVGRPLRMIRPIISGVTFGRQKRSFIFPRAKGVSAITAAAIMPRQVPSAAAQMPQSKTNRNRNSRKALSPDMKMFSAMLLLILPQMRR